MISRRDQFSPMHRHNIKAEDIINRGGGSWCSSCSCPTPRATSTARPRWWWRPTASSARMPAGSKLSLAPGESITLLPGVWHGFVGEGKDVLIGEVSTVNDDLTDNVFAEPLGRFSEIEEDEPPLHLLVSDYDKFLGKA